MGLVGRYLIRQRRLGCTARVPPRDYWTKIRMLCPQHAAEDIWRSLLSLTVS